MHTWIALLRGINVGGHNILPMKDLRELLAGLGYQNPRTYIQSGNCVFEADGGNADSYAKAIGTAIERQFGFYPDVLVLTAQELNEAIATNPYSEAAADLKTVHLFFLASPADGADLTKLDLLQKPGEAYELRKRVLYLYAPDGIGRSRLAASIERTLAVPVTARNLRSAMKISELAA